MHMKAPRSILFVFAFMTACAPLPHLRVPDLVVKEDFTGRQLRDGGIVAGGVVAEPGKFDLQQSEEFSTAMVRIFQWHRRTVPVHPTSRLRGALGDERYLEVMNEFAAADLAEGTLTSISTLLPEIRYLALARIEANTDGGTSQWRGETEKKARLLGPVRVTPIYVAHSRKVAMTLRIYDLKNRSAVYSGFAEDDQRNVLTFEETDAVTLLAKIAYDDTPPSIQTPPMPPTLQVVERIIGKFAANLPFCGPLYCPG